jgi:hypothetical protein
MDYKINNFFQSKPFAGLVWAEDVVVLIKSIYASPSARDIDRKDGLKYHFFSYLTIQVCL